jgi:hypothetical protein
MTHLPAYLQRALLNAILTYLNDRYLANISGSSETHTQALEVVGGCAELVSTVVSQNQALADHLSELCVHLESGVMTRSYGIRRVAVVVLSRNDGEKYCCIIHPQSNNDPQSVLVPYSRRCWSNLVISFSYGTPQQSSKKASLSTLILMLS